MDLKKNIFKLMSRISGGDGVQENASKEKKEVSSASSSSNFIVNELIKEYLDYNGYQNTGDILAIESNLPKKRITRVELETSLKVHSGPNAKQVPLLYSIVSDLRK